MKNSWQPVDVDRSVAARRTAARRRLLVVPVPGHRLVITLESDAAPEHNISL